MGGGDAIGEHVAAGLTSIGMFRESIISLPIGIDPSRLPEALPIEQRSSPVVLLARHQPNLGLEVQQLLEQQGQPCHCEVTPWSHRQWQTAMALDTLVVANPGAPGDNLYRDGVNAIVRPPEAQAMGSALLSLLDPNQISLRPTALQRQRWLEIATDGLANLWSQAREEFCQAGAVVQKGEEQGL